MSCKKFLSSYSQNNSFIETAGDLDELLVGTAYYNYQSGHYIMLYGMDDDAQLTWPATDRFSGCTGNRIAITGRLSPGSTAWATLENSDKFYNDLYSRIAGINTILHNVAELGKEK